MIKLFVGLGNPGPEYEATRHNAGFWWIDALARDWKLNLVPERSYHGLAARANIGGQSIWLLEPQTFMNLSGKSVAALARFFKIAPEEILVAHDELDVVPGQAKLKFGGSHAGHNGLRDIHAQLGTGDYWRLRLGIGHPGVKSEVINWVLKKPLKEQRDAIDDAIVRSLHALPALLAAKWKRPRPPSTRANRPGPSRRGASLATAARPPHPSQRSSREAPTEREARGREERCRQRGREEEACTACTGPSSRARWPSVPVR